MDILVSNIKVEITSFSEDTVKKIALKKAGLKECDADDIVIHKRSIDARKKDSIYFVFSVIIRLKEGRTCKENPFCKIYDHKELTFGKGTEILNHPPVIVGFGPCGMFAALYLARLGYNPIVIERGAEVDERVKAVNDFSHGGSLNDENNIQFGEGGAGTFSDGKLTTRINDPRCDCVLKDFVDAGAPKETALLAKPHIGTDNLRLIVKNIRSEIIRLGGRVMFNTKLLDITFKNNEVASVTTSKGEIPCEALILAIGHSARDTFKMLLSKNLTMENKPFSVGARIEHLQTEVDKALYGKFAGNPLLPKGEYQLSHRDAEGRGVYTFCMCPGGLVVPAASVEHTIVTNGMSFYNRAGKNANSALVVSVDSKDFGTHPLSGMEFQEKIEKKAYELSGSYKAPCQSVGNFMEDRAGICDNAVVPSYSIGTAEVKLTDVLPKQVTDHMKLGITIMGRRQPGFDAKTAVLTGPETRTSSPVRIVRESSTMLAEGIKGLYPCGEGAGYAGGIMSAAVDGVRAAEKISEVYKPIENFVEL